MCWSVPQTPQAPTFSSAARSGIEGQGTLWMIGVAPGPETVDTRTSGLAIMSLRATDPEQRCSGTPRFSET
jgi:hypothetical protein